ncbi:hypothetical protein ACFC5Z_13275 [Streptomyces sp. NPDC056004]|uniref:hypothetical protein n=1 Tax=Streptomyces sp. NPDC056004 TaxID=3345677 RepID=UPI0035D767C6
MRDGDNPRSGSRRPDPAPDHDLTATAERFAPPHHRPAAGIIELATRELPDSDDTVMELCR